MYQNKLFRKTRSQLAISYATVMGIILALLGLGVYQAIVHAHIMTLDRELKYIAGTLHDSLEWKLSQPGKIDPIVQEFLPNICLVEVKCSPIKFDNERHTLNALNYADYYIRLFNNSGKLVAIAGAYAQNLSSVFNPEPWQTLSDNQGNYYHQISLVLHTQDQQDWGYLQVGRSLQEINNYLNWVKLILGLGLPIAMILVGLASWWLAGLAMASIYQSYRQIQQFTADAAHELRTPIAAMLATVESALLMPSLDDKKARNLLEIFARQNHRIAQLVADLLLLSHLDKQPLYRLNHKCCLNDIVNDLVEELAALAIKNQIDLNSDIKTTKILTVFGDEEQLYRLISNLIVNGIQYTPKNGKVTVILDTNNYYGIIKIRDTGIGINPADQKQIFDKFYRVNSDRSRHTGGSGLGLAIAKAIALSHQGSLQVHSELNLGSIFTIKLPLINSTKSTKL